MSEIFIGVNVDYQPFSERDPSHELTEHEEGNVTFSVNQPLIEIHHKLTQLLSQCPDNVRLCWYADAQRHFDDFWESMEQASFHLAYGSEPTQ